LALSSDTGEDEVIMQFELVSPSPKTKRTQDVVLPLLETRRIGEVITHWLTRPGTSVTLQPGIEDVTEAHDGCCFTFEEKRAEPLIIFLSLETIRQQYPGLRAISEFVSLVSDDSPRGVSLEYDSAAAMRELGLCEEELEDGRLGGMLMPLDKAIEYLLMFSLHSHFDATISPLEPECYPDSEEEGWIHAGKPVFNVMLTFQWPEEVRRITPGFGSYFYAVADILPTC